MLKKLKVLGIASLLMLVGCNEGSPESSDDAVDGGGDSTSERERDTNSCSSFESGRYHNYFLDVGIDQDDVDAKIEGAWDQLMFGDPETEAVYFRAGENADGPLAYILDIDNNDVRSEGMSYGMMFAVQMDDREMFDALWNFARTYMWHGDPAHPFYEYFAWHVREDGSILSDTPAPDGDEYFVMALYFASARWGDAEGVYEYRRHADRLLSALKNRELITGDFERDNFVQSTTGTPIFHPDHKMVRFSPNEGYFDSAEHGDHTDPSYHLPAFYQLWALFGPEADRDFWLEAADISRDFFHLAAHPDTALTPDYAAFDGTPVANGNGDHDDFAYDAQRTVMNWSVDWAWWCADPGQQDLSDTLQAFFDSQGSNYPALYELDGTPKPENSPSTGLVAMNAVSALAATDATLSEEFILELWYLATPAGQYRYYDGMLYMFALLHVSGRFQIYEPEPA